MEKVKLPLILRIKFIPFLIYKKIDKFMTSVERDVSVLWKVGKKLKQAQSVDDYNEYVKLILLKLEAGQHLLGTSFLFILLILFSYIFRGLAVPMNLKLSIVGIYLLLNILENRVIQYENYQRKDIKNKEEIKRVFSET